jgi:hypothetical protein
VGVFCPILAYLWARAEFKARGNRLWVPFPHNLRFLYLVPKWQELLAQSSIVLFILYLVLSALRLQQLLSIVLPVVPSEEQGAFLVGLSYSPAVDVIFSGIVPLYASYRVALVSYFFRSAPPATLPQPT